MNKSNFQGHKHTEDTKLKMSLSHRGKRVTSETRRKISLAQKGRKKTWLIGRKQSLETTRKRSMSLRGRKLSEINKIRIGLAQKGEKSRWWKGGITKERDFIENSFYYKRWRTTIFERDDYTCQDCGRRGVRLNVHHKKEFSKLLEEIKNTYPLLSLRDGALLFSPLWDLKNGITLCEKCHKKRHNKKVD